MLRKAGSLLRDAFSLAVYGETAGDIARKPEVAEKLFQQSLPFKPEAEQPSVDNAYEDRLREVLMGTKTKDIQTFLDNKVAVCLDTRIYNQKDGWHREILGVYYNQGKDGGIAALWDSGKTSANSGFFERSAFSHGGTTLNALADKIRDGGIAAENERYYAARRSRHYGYTRFFTDWREEGYFSPGAVKKNPGLKEPPRRRSPGV